jgi:hypothetical protein
MNGQQDNHTQHSAENIIRYLSGKMGREENHAFERSMVDDDLLADAVEGYQLMRESMSDAEILSRAKKNALQPEQKKEEKIAVVGITRYRWVQYAVAASFVLAAGWWIFTLTTPEKVTNGPDVAKSEQIAPVTAQDSTIDVAAVENNNAALADSEQPTSATVSELPTKPKKEKVENTQDVATHRKKPVASDEGNINNKQADLNETVVAQQKASDAAKKIAPGPMSSRASSASATQLSFIKIDTLNAVPTDGWEKYEAFLAKTLPKLPTKTTGKATIEINPLGSLEKVTIVGGYSELEKRAAEKAIQSGPSWKNKVGRKVQAILEWQ